MTPNVTCHICRKETSLKEMASELVLIKHGRAYVICPACETEIGISYNSIGWLIYSLESIFDRDFNTGFPDCEQEVDHAAS